MTRIAKTAPKPIALVAAFASTKRAGDLVRLWAHRRRSRAALDTLDAHALRDIGLDRMTAEAEATRPFWR